MSTSPTVTSQTDGLPTLSKHPSVVGVYTLAYSVVFVLSVVNNSAVLVVIRQTPQLRTVTNMFLANLAVADLIVTFLVLPVTLLSNILTGMYASEQ
jgi:neuropeptide FF receptor 2